MTCVVGYLGGSRQQWPGCTNCGAAHPHPDDRTRLIIERPHFKSYIARVRRSGARRYEIVGRSRSRRKAYRMLADAMESGRYYKRGDVLADEGPGSYYEPTLLVEMTR